MSKNIVGIAALRRGPQDLVVGLVAQEEWGVRAVWQKAPGRVIGCRTVLRMRLPVSWSSEFIPNEVKANEALFFDASCPYS